MLPTAAPRFAAALQAAPRFTEASMKSHVAIDGVIALVKELGFKAKGTTLNRPGAEGKTIHVVYLQSGLRFLAGKFTIEMGVFLPSVYPLELWAKGKEAPVFPRITDCQVRARISQFTGAGDVWWTSDDPKCLPDLEASIRIELPRFFAVWGEPPAILENWRAAGPTPLKERVSPLAAAVLLHNEGRDEESAALLKELCLSSKAKAISPDYWLDVALKLGLDMKA